MKSGLRKQFRRILDDPNSDYCGNISIGEHGDLTLDDLKGLGFDAVVVATGAQSTKKLGLEGEDSLGVFHTKDMVYHYTNLSPFSRTSPLIGKRVAINRYG